MVDLSTKIKEDPLFMIRKSEEEKRKSVVSNPVKVCIDKIAIFHSGDALVCV